MHAMTGTTPDVIIIRGAPGSGKSHTAKCLAKHFRGGVRKEVDTLRAMVIAVDWTNQAEHRSMLSLSTRVVVEFIRRGFRPVMVVDTLGGNKLAKFLVELRSLDECLDVRAFALVTAPEVLRARVEARPADHFKDIDICEKQNADIAKHLQPSEHLVDNTALTPEETAEAITGHCAQQAANWDRSR